jgi:hypothetical protein
MRAELEEVEMRQGGIGEKSTYRRQQEEAAEDRQKAKQHEEVIGTITAVTAGIDRMTAEYAANRHQANSHESGKRKREWFTFWALVAAAASAVLTLTVSHCDNRAIIREAERAAEIATDTEKRQLRAYVFVDNIGIAEIDSAAGPRTWVRIKNSGLTPAYGLIHENVYSIREYPLKTPLPVMTPLRATANNYSFSELGPGSIHDKPRRHRFITPLEIAGLSAGTSVIYFYGLVTFTDAFGCHRWIRYKSVLGGPVANRGLDNLVITDDSNDASDETAADCLFKATQLEAYAVSYPGLNIHERRFVREARSTRRLKYIPFRPAMLDGDSRACYIQSDPLPRIDQRRILRNYVADTPTMAGLRRGVCASASDRFAQRGDALHILAQMGPAH